MKPSERLVTLMELLRVYAHLYLRHSNHLAVFDDWMSSNPDKPIMDDQNFPQLVRALKSMQALCETGELPVTQIPLDMLVRGLNSPDRMKSNQAVQHFLKAILDRLPDEMSTKLYLQLPHSKTPYFDEPFKGWEAVIGRIPECSRDVEEMNKCFALSRYAASMFHAMHVAEWGAIYLAPRINVTDPIKGWGSTTKKLAELVAAGRSKLSSNESVTVTFDFIEQMNQETQNMKLAWRNKIDHAANYLAIVPNAEFTPDIAEHIIISVRVMMGRMIEGTKP